MKKKRGAPLLNKETSKLHFTIPVELNNEFDQARKDKIGDDVSGSFKKIDAFKESLQLFIKKHKKEN